ncbi:iron chelate uptake ABC transporter family permease subunit [Ignicoccus hospitalis]|uniref:Transport system permease protein n=1 Tax=Ignicoccus hospitalis (strain KIN4/I / DSM 18386 / JCM 14125) TaxID=453591 RepID=A8ABS7_IGNH4|nr:iron chelate uptake ABC transporter family permease subunit [Ignicoccus hospitalis]ABU82379.1 transport system permease protein [Ignicoccus hospitalis KIN4/I]HIH90854.1 iron ABC transporter permease [Desulfurococcaceae archaeon]
MELPILRIRAERVWADALAAAGLSSAATLLQSAYSNDLMDPYLIGTLSGAMAALAAAVLLLGLSALVGPQSYLAAFFGALVPGALTALAAFKLGPRQSLTFGIALTLSLQGVASLLSYLAAAESGLPLLPMLLGTTQYASEEALRALTVVVALAWATAQLVYKEVSSLEYPEGFPRSFAIVEEKAALKAVLISAASSSAVVSCCGVLPFLGLIGGVVGRRLSPPGSGKALVVAFVTSYLVMVTTDFVANSVETPYGYLPVGAFLSLIGGLALAALLVKSGGT